MFPFPFLPLFLLPSAHSPYPSDLTQRASRAEHSVQAGMFALARASSCHCYNGAGRRRAGEVQGRGHLEGVDERLGDGLRPGRPQHDGSGRRPRRARVSAIPVLGGSPWLNRRGRSPQSATRTWPRAGRLRNRMREAKGQILRRSSAQVLGH